jgi:hypothetical protein
MNIKIFGVALVIFIFSIAGCKSEDSIVTPITEGSQPPNAPSNPSPSNGQLNVSHFGIVLQWSCTDPDANDTLRYDVRYGYTNNPTTLLTSNTLNRAADLGTADTSRTIFWKVTAKDNHGLTKDGPVWNFTTGH